MFISKCFSITFQLHKVHLTLMHNLFSDMSNDDKVKKKYDRPEADMAHKTSKRNQMFAI